MHLPAHRRMHSLLALPPLGTLSHPLVPTRPLRPPLSGPRRCSLASALRSTTRSLPSTPPAWPRRGAGSAPRPGRLPPATSGATFSCGPCPSSSPARPAVPTRERCAPPSSPPTGERARQHGMLRQKGFTAQYAVRRITCWQGEPCGCGMCVSSRQQLASMGGEERGKERCTGFKRLSPRAAQRSISLMTPATPHLTPCRLSPPAA